MKEQLLTVVVALFLTATLHGMTDLPLENLCRRNNIPKGEAVRVELSPDSVREYDFQACVEINGMFTQSPMGKTSWEVDWYRNDADDSPCLRARVRWGCIPGELSFEGHFMEVVVEAPDSCGNWQRLLTNRFGADMNFVKGSNTLMARSNGKKLTFYAGNYTLNWVGEIPDPGIPDYFTVSGNNKWHLRFGGVWYYPAAVLPIVPDEEIQKVASLRGDTPAGLWEFLDRDTDGVLAKLGGKYNIAVVPHQGCEVIDHGKIPDYDIVYLTGGVTRASTWKWGMVKGHIYATPFENHYILRWLDANKEDMGDECSVDIADGLILSANFPVFKSKIRFVRTAELPDRNRRPSSVGM